MVNPLAPGPDPYANWVDRLGMIEFIDDQKAETSHPSYHFASIANTDTHKAEVAIWYL